jgi:hypothetical protein
MKSDTAFKPWPTPEREVPGLRRRSWWFYAGITLAVVLAIAGLAFVAFIILVAISLSQWGNNK